MFFNTEDKIRYINEREGKYDWIVFVFVRLTVR